MYSLIPNPKRLDSMFLSADTISLTEAQIDRASAISQRESIEAKQWQLYLNTLAQLGVENWLQNRAPELRVLSDRSLESNQLRIGNFRIHLIATDELEADEVAISRSAIDSTFIPHLYVLVEVLEELGQVQIRSAIEQAQLIEQVRSMQPEDETYWLNAESFDANPDRLLLWLRCLDADALPTVAPSRTSGISIANAVTQGAMNVGLWLNDRLDQMAEEFAWILLPAPAPNLELQPMRSANEEFNQVLHQLMQQGRINALPQARGGYRDFQCEDALLRLYAMTWKAAGDSDWTLLLVLGAQPGAALPLGTRLQVRDADRVLAEPVLHDRAQDYLFTQVIGTEAERFWVSIGFQNGATLTLPPFTFIHDAT